MKHLVRLFLNLFCLDFLTLRHMAEFGRPRIVREQALYILRKP